MLGSWTGCHKAPPNTTKDQTPHRQLQPLHCALPHCKPEFFWSSFSAFVSYFGSLSPAVCLSLLIPLPRSIVTISLNVQPTKEGF